MKTQRFFIFIIFALLAHISVAQLDVTTEGINIQPSDSTKLYGEKTFSFKLNPVVGLSFKKVEYKILSIDLNERLKKTSGVDLSDNTKLSHKPWEIKQRFSEDRKDLEKYMRDYYLGDLKTTSKLIYIKCRDHEYVDGDRVRITLNNAVIHPNLTLKGDYYMVDVDLQEGFNTISFTALNEGKSSPNTAEVKVYDENGKLLASEYWLITTGYKASLMVLKE